MDTSWEATDVDLEKLLDFDELNAEYSTKGFRQDPPADPLVACISTSETGLGLVDKDSKGVNFRNSYESSQANEAGKDHESLLVDVNSRKDSFQGSYGRRVEDLNGKTSLFKADGKKFAPSSTVGALREGNEELSLQDCNRSQDGAADRTAEEAIRERESFVTDPSVAARIAIEAEHTVRKGDKTLLSGIARNRRAPGATVTGAFVDNSQASPLHSRKRPCEDSPVNSRRLTNDHTAIDVPRVLNKKGGLQGERTSELEDVVSLCSSAVSTDQEAAHKTEICHESGPSLSDRDQNCASNRTLSPSASGLRYKIPGPAGALQNWLRKNGQTFPAVRQYENSCRLGKTYDEAIVGADAFDFTAGPWLAAMEFLNDGTSEFGNYSSRTPIATIKATFTHIPQIVAVISNVEPNRVGDLFVKLKDPTGTISGSIQRKVLNDEAHLIVPGAVIILQKVAVFSPNPLTHYLNITVKNVVQVFGKDTVAARSGVSGTTNFTKCNPTASGGDRSRSRPVRIYEPLSAQAPQKGHDSEHRGAPRDCIQSREYEVTHLNDIAANAEDFLNLKSQQIFSTSCKSPDAVRPHARPGSFPHTVSEEGVDKRPNAGIAIASTSISNPPTDHHGEFQVEARGSQKAIAKAAGWDFDEDIELLFADDFTLAK